MPGVPGWPVRVVGACPPFPKVAGAALQWLWTHVALTYPLSRPLFTRQIQHCLQIPATCHEISRPGSVTSCWTLCKREKKPGSHFKAVKMRVGIFSSLCHFPSRPKFTFCLSLFVFFSLKLGLFFYSPAFSNEKLGNSRKVILPPHHVSRKFCTYTISGIGS